MRNRRPLPGPEKLERRPIADGEEYVAYHVVELDDPGDPTFVDSFLSRAAKGDLPRPGTPEERHPSLADGISAYRTREAAAETAARAVARGRSFGEFTAEMRMTEGLGIEIAEWGARGHLTVWGDPVILAATAADIRPIT